MCICVCRCLAAHNRLSVCRAHMPKTMQPVAVAFGNRNLSSGAHDPRSAALYVATNDGQVSGDVRRVAASVDTAMLSFSCFATRSTNCAAGERQQTRFVAVWCAAADSRAATCDWRCRIRPWCATTSRDGLATKSASEGPNTHTHTDTFNNANDSRRPQKTVTFAQRRRAASGSGS